MTFRQGRVDRRFSEVGDWIPAPSPEGMDANAGRFMIASHRVPSHPKVRLSATYFIESRQLLESYELEVTCPSCFTQVEVGYASPHDPRDQTEIMLADALARVAELEESALRWRRAADGWKARFDTLAGIVRDNYNPELGWGEWLEEFVLREPPPIVNPVIDELLRRLGL